VQFAREGAKVLCVERFGRVDILHNNVGIDRVGGPVETTEASWDEVIRINLTSQSDLQVHPAGDGTPTRRCDHQHEFDRRYPMGRAPSISYASSKAAIIQLTQTVALQYARKGVRANTIVLGVVRTPALETWVKGLADNPQQLWQHLDESAPRGRIGDAWDAAGAAVFLASDEANYINGPTIVVDGGLSATIDI
jgi:NAD(P)-dependent dehydrogenase (short-subunit alcohol dehydrogenase family)